MKLPPGMTCKTVWVTHPRNTKPTADLVLEWPGYVHTTRDAARFAKNDRVAWNDFMVSPVLIICVEKTQPDAKGHSV